MRRLDKVKKVYSFWGKFPWLYAAQDYFTFIGKPKFIRKRAVEKLNLRKGDRMFEVACGNGRNFPYIMETVGERGALLGFDYSREMLAYAEKFCAQKGWHNVELMQGDAAELQVKEKDYDGILGVLGISAIPNWEAALKRCHAVLKTGGKLSVCDARPFFGAFRPLNPLIKLIYTNFAAWDPSKNIPEKMKEIFGNVEIEYFNAGTMFVAVSIKQ